MPLAWVKCEKQAFLQAVKNFITHFTNLPCELKGKIVGILTFFRCKVDWFWIVAKNASFSTIFQPLNQYLQWPLKPFLSPKGFQPFFGGNTHFENEKLVTHQEYPNYNQTAVLYKRKPNYMYQKLKVKVWNYLATHWKKLAAHKCVETPWQRTTALAKNFFKLGVLLLRFRTYPRPFLTPVQVFSRLIILWIRLILGS